MVFKHSVICDNTAENREHLRRIGFDIVELKELRDTHDLIRTNRLGLAFPFSSKKNCINYDNYVNCIGNHDLSKAVTAIRSDGNHYLQYFVCHDKTNEKNKWVLCLKENIYDDDRKWWSYKYHRATLEELIEHFKK